MGNSMCFVMALQIGWHNAGDLKSQVGCGLLRKGLAESEENSCSRHGRDGEDGDLGECKRTYLVRQRGRDSAFHPRD